MNLRNLSLAVLLLLPLGAGAQSVVVNAHVLDPNGLSYQNCRYSIDFLNLNTTPGAPPPNLNGSTFQTSYPGFRCDGNGFLTATLPDNNQVQPQPSQWKFTICDQTGVYCFFTPVTITAPSPQNITAVLQANSVVLPSSGGGGSGSVTSVGPGSAGGIILNWGSFGFDNQTTTPNLTIVPNTVPAGFFWAGPFTGPLAAPSYRAIAGSDLPAPQLTALGGVLALDCSSLGANYFIQSIIAGSGSPNCVLAAGGSGSGTVNSSTTGKFAEYLGVGTTVSGSPNLVETAATLIYSGSGGTQTPKMATTGTGAGIWYIGAGSAQALGSSQIGLTAPSSVTAFNLVFPGAAGSGFLYGVNSCNTVTASFLCPGASAGDFCYYNGTGWVILSGNASGTKVLQETAAGVPSWVSGGGGGCTTFDCLASGTNTTAAMVVGSGASIALTGTGAVYANNVPSGGMTYHTAGAGVTTVAAGTSASSPSVSFPSSSGTLALTSQISPATTTCGGANTAVPCKVVPTSRSTALTATTIDTPASAGQFLMCGTVVTTGVATGATISLNAVYSNGTSTNTHLLLGANGAVSGSDAGSCYPFYAAAGQPIQFTITISTGAPTFTYMVTLEQKQ